jgi:hypothetical protein
VYQHRHRLTVVDAINLQSGAAMGGLIVLQSLWAMERRHTDGIERSLEENVAMIIQAGFGGVSAHCTSRDNVRRIVSMFGDRKLVIEGQAFPKTTDDLKPVLDIASEFGVRHINLQPDARPRRLEDCFPLIEGWQRLGEDAGIPVYLETHRDRMTTDLHFTLDLLDRYPGLRLISDLSHILVGREFAWPVSDENHALVRQILDSSWAFHGRVATREQVQIEISFPHHRPWVELFLEWWDYGFRSFRRRAGRDAPVCFTCELGPKPYAITGRDGNDTTDRWTESLMMKDLVETLFARIESEEARRPAE